MKAALLPLLAASLAAATPTLTVTRDVRYTESTHPRHVLDIHAPAGAKDLPVVFWIHGGGWQAGDKGDVKLKPQAFAERGCVFVSTNYRLLPAATMGDIMRDVAAAFAWTHANIARHGGDPRRILVGGHSAGAQLAALLCADEKYLRAHGLTFAPIKGCIPVDGDTYDVPAIIEVAEVRARAHGFPLPTNGHRQKFGNDPVLHRDFSAVTHIAKDRGIPPFLILHVAGHPDTTAQAQRLGAVLKAAGVSARVFGARNTDHNKLNDHLGETGDPATTALWEFVATVIK
ncbi:MAG: alpha/beta hydrolase [Verrucomicrobia bacterium]|nr:alpha/beta hydrolase [Verrucomicrobiota bacterium]